MLLLKMNAEYARLVWRAILIASIAFCLGLFVAANNAYQLAPSSSHLQREMLAYMFWAAMTGIVLFSGWMITELVIVLRRLDRQHQPNGTTDYPIS